MRQPGQSVEYTRRQWLVYEAVMGGQTATEAAEDVDRRAHGSERRRLDDSLTWTRWKEQDQALSRHG